MGEVTVAVGEVIVVEGEVTAEAGEQPTKTSREGDFSILAVTRRSERRARYSERRSHCSGSRKAQPSSCDSGQNFKRGYKKKIRREDKRGRRMGGSRAQRFGIGGRRRWSARIEASCAL